MDFRKLLDLDSSNLEIGNARLKDCRNFVLSKSGNNLEVESGFDISNINLLPSDINDVITGAIDSYTFKTIGIVSTTEDILFFRIGTINGNNEGVIIRYNSRTNVSSTVQRLFIFTENPIQGTAYYNYLGDLIVAWINGNPGDKPKILNCNTPESNEDLLLDQNLTTFSYTEFSDSLRGGSLQSGSYNFAIIYYDAYGNSSNVSNFSQTYYAIPNKKEVIIESSLSNLKYIPIEESIVDINFRLNINITNSNYTTYKIIVYHRDGNNIVNIKISSIKNIISVNNTIYINDISNWSAYNLSDIYKSNIEITKANAISQFDGKLLLGNVNTLDESTILNHKTIAIIGQQIANNIICKYFKTPISGFTDNGDKFTNDTYCLTSKSFQPGEVYALYMSLKSTKGTTLGCWHIPGRPLRVFENNTIEVNQTESISKKHYELYSYAQVDGEFPSSQTDNQEGVLGVWVNQDEQYPSNMPISNLRIDSDNYTEPAYYVNSNYHEFSLIHDSSHAQVLANTNIRHHRFPFNTVRCFALDDDSTFNSFGIKFENIRIPYELRQYVKSIEFYYAKRSENNSKIIDTSIYKESVPKRIRKDPSTYTAGHYDIQSDRLEKCIISNDTTAYNNAEYIIATKSINQLRNTVFDNSAPENAQLDKSIIYNIYSDKAGRAVNNYNLFDLTYKNLNTLITSKHIDGDIAPLNPISDNTFSRPINPLYWKLHESELIDKYKRISIIPLKVNYTILTHPLNQFTDDWSNINYKNYIISNVINCYANYNNQQLVLIGNLEYNNSLNVDVTFNGVGDTFYTVNNVGILYSDTSSPWVQSNGTTNSSEYITASMQFTIPAYTKNNKELKIKSINLDTTKATANYEYPPGTPLTKIYFPNIWNRCFYPMVDRVYFIESLMNGGDNWIDNYVEIAYNKAYSNVNDIYQPIVTDITAKYTYKQPNRIYKSSSNNNESVKLQWRYIFDDYHDMPKNKGEIISMHSSDDKIFIQQRYGLFIAQLKDSLNTIDGEIGLKNTEIFTYPPKEVIPNLNESICSTNRFGNLLSNIGFISLDNINAKIYLINDSVKELSINGVQDYVKTLLTPNLINPYYDLPLYPIVDNEFNRIIIISKFGTISYNYLHDTWVSKHDYTPNYYFNLRNKIHFIYEAQVENINNSIYSINSDTTNRYYFSEIYESYLDIVFNFEPTIPKLLQSLNWQSEFTKNNVIDYKYTFDKLMVYNDTQCTGYLNLNSNFDWFDKNSGTLVNGIWHFNDINDNVIDDSQPILINNEPNVDNITIKDWYDSSKFIASYFICRFKYTNPDYNNKFKVFNIGFEIIKDNR